MSKRTANRERWRRLLHDQETSGLSASAFCRKAGVRSSNFFKWRRKLRVSPGFAEVQVEPDRSWRPARAIELRLAGRGSIVVPPGFDRRTLIDVLGILELRLADRPDREREAGR